MKKTVSLILTELILISLLPACGEEANVSSGGPADSGDEVILADDTEYTDEIISDDLPSDLDFGGEEFAILTREASYIHAKVDVEELTGDVFNDALYNCNRNVENRLNIVLKDCPAEEFGEQNSMGKRAVMSGDSTYDLFYLEDYPTLSLALDGYMMDFDNIPYIDLTKPYWSQSINPSLTIHNRRFFAYSDSNLTPTDYTHVLVFNKNMAEKYNLPNIYEMVTSGEWTIDNYGKAASDVTADVDGNSVMDENDRYGFLSQPKHVLPSFWVASEAQCIKKDENDTPIFNIVSDKKFSSVYDKIFAVTRDNKSWFENKMGSNSDLTLNNMFINDQALFFDNTMYYIAILREMEHDFGILPYPKWDEAQVQYHARVEGGCVPGVPVTSANETNMIGAVLEAWASEASKLVIPAYFEISLKGKSARDEDSEAMLDLIYDCRTYDLGDTYWCELLRDGIFEGLFTKDKRDMVSEFTKKDDKIQKNIQEIIDAFDALENG